MLLFFDTETTGLPKNWDAPASDINNWPRLVQLAYLIYDDDGNLLSSHCDIIKPFEFSIPREASNIHRIDNETANRVGKQLLNVLLEFKQFLNNADYVIGHNISFDEKIIDAEFLRCGLKEFVSAKTKICTMLSSIDFCAIQTSRGYKYPKLSELHHKLFNTYFNEAHQADIDIKATAKCFWKLVEMNVIKLPKKTDRSVQENKQTSLIDTETITLITKRLQLIQSLIDLGDKEEVKSQIEKVKIIDKVGLTNELLLIIEKHDFPNAHVLINLFVNLLLKIGNLDCFKNTSPILYDNIQINKIEAINKELLIPYRIGDFWGMCDENKKIIIECIYLNEFRFHEGVANVNLNGRHGLINKNGDAIIPIIYQNKIHFKEDLAKVILDWKHGFINEKGENVISFIYEDAWDFCNGFARVKQDGKIGYINKKGEAITPCIYYDAHDFHGGLAAVMLNFKWGYINVYGESVISFNYENVGEFSEGLAAIKLNSKWGYINNKAEYVTPCIYDSADRFREGIARVRQNDKYGYLNSKGEHIFQCIYDKVWPFDGRTNIEVVGKNGKRGAINNKGEEVIPFIYDALATITHELNLASYYGKFGFINNKGTNVIPYIYDAAGHFRERMAIVKQNNKYGYINNKGEQVIPCIYDYAHDFYEGLARVTLDGKYGYINNKGEQVIPFIYDNCSDDFREGFARVRQNSKYGFINEKGEQIIRCIYDYVESFKEGLALVRTQQDKFGYIDTRGVEYWED